MEGAVNMGMRHDTGARLSNRLVFVLMCIAAYVTGRQIDAGAWPPIIAYWAVLTAKNFVDWVRTLVDWVRTQR